MQPQTVNCQWPCDGRNSKWYARLSSVGIIAYNLLNRRLAIDGYFPEKHTSGIYTYQTKDTTFSLVVDNVDVKYVSKENDFHLINSLKRHYSLTIDFLGLLYINISLKWNCVVGIVDLFAFGYIKQVLKPFPHVLLRRERHSPNFWDTPIFGSNTQLTAPIDNYPTLPTSGKYVSKRLWLSFVRRSLR